MSTPTHDDDDAHVERPTDGAEIFHVALGIDTTPDIAKRAAWNAIVCRRCARYARGHARYVPIDGTALDRLASEWEECVSEIRTLRERLNEGNP